MAAISAVCTLHQVVGDDGLPRVTGSEIRTPDGDPIPWVLSVETRAVAGETWWETTVRLRTVFGDPIAGRSGA